MTADPEEQYREILAGIIEEILRSPGGLLRVPALAASAGFSRFHLARLFHRTTGETLDEFIRRIRAERAAFTLIHSDELIATVGEEVGYGSVEAFSRAFRSVFGALPTQFRKEKRSWMIDSASGIHWNADWVTKDPPPIDLEQRTVWMPVRHVRVWRVLGSYTRLGESWETFHATFSSVAPRNASFIALYHDQLYTHPVGGKMRADLGWTCELLDAVPKGMRRASIPAGYYSTTKFLTRAEHHEAWSYVSGRHPKRVEGRKRVGYDEYSSYPIPFDRVFTKILVGLSRT